MKTEEDEAFDELAKRQGDWGGGFPAKRQMAADKLHWSDCAVHNGPAYPAGKCDCDARLSKYAETLLEENNIPDTPTARAVYRKMLERVEDDDDIQDYKKPWVSLTDEEIEIYLDWDDWQVGTDRSIILGMVRDIETKLKGKNNG
jgi:hypothetical protein